MTTNPWGMQIGNYCHGNRYTIPVILPIEKGGMCLQYSQNNSKIAENFIENIVLNFATYFSHGQLHIHLWDYAIHKRFPYLAELSKLSIFHVAQNHQSANTAFAAIEYLVQQRHKTLLDVNTPDLIHYNQQAENKEDFYLLVINGDDYPDSHCSLKRWQNFFHAAASAGVYIILYTTTENNDEEQFAVRDYLRGKLPIVFFEKYEWFIPEQTFAHIELKKWYQFLPLKLNKKLLLRMIAGHSEQKPRPLLGENLSEYNDLVDDVVTDLKLAEEEKRASEDVQRRLAAAAEHQKEHAAKLEAKRRERQRIEAEKLRQQLEQKRQAELERQLMKEQLQKKQVQEMQAQSRARAEKKRRAEQERFFTLFKLSLATMMVLFSFGLTGEFLFNHIPDMHSFSYLLGYVKFASLFLFICLYIGTWFHYSQEKEREDIKDILIRTLFMVIVINIFLLAVIIVMVLLVGNSAEFESFIKLFLYYASALFLMNLVFRK